MSTELIAKAEEILTRTNLPDRHSKFQLEKFVVGKEPTGHAQLWQIVRELEARKETVESFKKDLADAEDNLELFDLKIERLNREIRQWATKDGDCDCDLEIQEREINIRKLQREKETLVCAARKVSRKLDCVLEEMAFFVQAYDAVVQQLGDMKPLDDEQAQREMWNEKLLEEFNLRILLQRPLDPELVRTIMCLPDEASVKQHMVKALEARQQQMIARGAEQGKLNKPQANAQVRVTANG